jgi:formate dehydrogenase major subunit
VHKVAAEINGYYHEDVYDEKASPPKLVGKKGDLVPNFVSLRDDGSTSSGNWLYSGSYTLKDGKAVNMMARRGKEDPTGLGLYPNWAWAWPVNRRVIYNRASVDLKGNPWDPKRPVLKWRPANAATGKPAGWEGDIPDGPAPPLADEKAWKLPFIMKPLGVGSIFGSGLGDGPFPEHYEPLESPVPDNPMSKKHRVNPTLPIEKLRAMAKDPDFLFSLDFKRYPYVATTYRVSEHWQTGVMTRHLPWLLEMQPRLFVELDRELAAEKGIENGDTVAVTSARGQIRAVAMVTARFKAFKIGDTNVHMVGIPWCFGWQYPADGSGGDSANLLTPFLGDPNTLIPESKAFMVDISKFAEKTVATPPKSTTKIAER